MSDRFLDPARWPAMPELHSEFLRGAVRKLSADARLVGVAAGGSFLTGELDPYSDLDLVLAVEPAHWDAMLAERRALAEGLGSLLSAFTGEHVGEPRLLICLYGPPLLHVDLKFVSLEDVGQRVEDPAVLWERGERVSSRLTPGEARYPGPDAQWIEDRFWPWVHYVTDKIARGELFEALDALAFLRANVIGPLALERAGHRPSGVRRLEDRLPDLVPRLRETLGAHDPRACACALEAAVDLYLDLRAPRDGAGLVVRSDAERAARNHLRDLLRALELRR
jgi:predicted nucleotidyltransferase